MLNTVTNMVNSKTSGLTERQKWYYKIDNVMYFKVKVRNKTLILGRDKKTELTRIQIGEDKNAPTVVQQVIEAVQNGELDQAIAEHLK